MNRFLPKRFVAPAVFALNLAVLIPFVKAAEKPAFDILEIERPRSQSR